MKFQYQIPWKRPQMESEILRNFIPLIFLVYHLSSKLWRKGEKRDFRWMHAVSDEAPVFLLSTECPKIYCKFVLHLLKYIANLTLSRCSTDLNFVSSPFQLILLSLNWNPWRYFSLLHLKSLYWNMLRIQFALRCLLHISSNWLYKYFVQIFGVLNVQWRT